MKVKRYVSKYAIRVLMDKQKHDSFYMAKEPQPSYDNEITIEIPYPPLEVAGYICSLERTSFPFCLDNLNCSNDKTYMGCRKIKLVEDKS